MARPNPLADPEFAQLVAQAFVDGNSRADMCDTFGVKDPATITRWRRDPRVKAISMKLIEDRVVQVSRRVDSVIEARLQNAGEMTITELLAIRKEFLGGALRQQTERADSETVEEAQTWLEQNPDAAAELDEILLNGAPGSTPSE